MERIEGKKIGEFLKKYPNYVSPDGKEAPVLNNTSPSISNLGTNNSNLENPSPQAEEKKEP